MEKFDTIDPLLKRKIKFDLNMNDEGHINDFASYIITAYLSGKNDKDYVKKDIIDIIGKDDPNVNLDSFVNWLFTTYIEKDEEDKTRTQQQQQQPQQTQQQSLAQKSLHQNDNQNHHNHHQMQTGPKKLLDKAITDVSKNTTVGDKKTQIKSKANSNVQNTPQISVKRTIQENKIISTKQKKEEAIIEESINQFYRAGNTTAPTNTIFDRIRKKEDVDKKHQIVGPRKIERSFEKIDNVGDDVKKKPKIALNATKPDSQQNQATLSKTITTTTVSVSEPLKESPKINDISILTNPPSKHEQQQQQIVQQDNHEQEQQTLPGTNKAQMKIKKRCKNWPACTNTNCMYIHPSETCPYFPKCAFGESCLYIHPSIPCKFGIGCTRPDCAYTHPRMPFKYPRNVYFQNHQSGPIKQRGSTNAPESQLNTQDVNS